ncbi:MAG TPA: DUF4416 family protein [Phycisphaerae bacterium]|nr:DUF4416 family protein [Phycisphaerae bacterium]HRY69730.1 DUF4416 family protein [Phycisphaerae bacterium]HSA29370.1 DUF4416 family protein [Phycisphaerae bacterium]
MGTARSPRPVNLVCGLISNDPDLMNRAVKLLNEYFGATDEVTELWPFDDTDYYALEMGEDLRRQFISFERVVDPVQLAAVKVLTNEMERRIARDCGLPADRRPVNLDPGYLTLSKLVLATTKDFGHRVYLREGIYAESTLHYEHGRWTAWPWTYPDYAGPRYHEFFDRVRERLRVKLNTWAAESSSDKGTTR